LTSVLQPARPGEIGQALCLLSCRARDRHLHGTDRERAREAFGCGSAVPAGM